MPTRFDNRFSPKYIEDLDQEAAAFLKYYGFEDAIETPIRIPIDYIATTRMNLDIVEDESLSSDGSIDGVITFAAGIIEVYDWSTNQTVGHSVSTPTIFLDTCLYNEGRRNNTLAHECYHWYAHRKYFIYLMSHCKGAEYASRCNAKSTEINTDDPFVIDIAKMEWQAHNIAPKILMPKIAFKKKAEELFNKCKAKTPLQRQRVYPIVIPELARFFGTSEQSVSIRLEELQYNRALAYWEEKFENSITINKHTGININAKKEKMVSISITDAFKLYLENKLFKEILDTGAFIYVDGFFVLNQEKYVTVSADGKIKLTAFAQSNLATCTLSISKKLIATSSSTEAQGLLFRSNTIYAEKNIFNSNPQNAELNNKANEFEKQFSRTLSISTHANDVLWQHMQKQHWNTGIFQNKTLLDPINYSRVQKNTYNFKMPAIIAMGIGLCLPLTEMNLILSLAGFTFNANDKQQQAYQFLFTSYFGKTIEECNELLEKLGLKTLGSKSRG